MEFLNTAQFYIQLMIDSKYSSFIFGIIGIIGTIYTLSSISKKNLFYIIDTTKIITNNFKHPNLNISFNGTDIDYLSMSRVALWNGGNKVIDKSDITSNKLRIEFNKSIHLLGAQIIRCSSETNMFKITIQDNYIYINFEYMEKHEGVMIEILHNAKHKNDLQVKGKFISIKKFKEIYNLPIGYLLAMGLYQQSTVILSKIYKKQWQKQRTAKEKGRRIYVLGKLIGISMIMFGILAFKYEDYFKFSIDRCIISQYGLSEHIISFILLFIYLIIGWWVMQSNVPIEFNPLITDDISDKKSCKTVNHTLNESHQQNKGDNID